ncbi:capsule biosynthesis protein [Hyphomicrobium sp.]|uniref:capsule biosynthesis protein n=1 Tax=Hyphomicrobium sp. TaxID=82 RepID=UPI002FDE1294
MTRRPGEIDILELVSISEAPGSPEETSNKPGTLQTWLRKNFGFLACVAGPTLVFAIYFFLIAADRYESESRFVVRNPSAATANPLSALGHGAGATRSTDDAYVTHAYIASRDALRKLITEADLLERLGRAQADVIWRYPGPVFAHTEERLWKHFQSFFEIDYDHTTGISTLRVQAFRPQDAQALAEALIQSAETLINRLSERSQGDAVRMAERHVAENEAKAREALDRMTAFRRRTAIVDPGRLSAAGLDTITRLALEIANTQASLAELLQSSPDSPQASGLRHRIAAYDAQIQKEREVLAGSDTSLAPLIAEYETLVLNREFAERAFGSAQAALDMARVDSERQRLFLDRISTPSLPDYPKYPKRALSTIYAFLILLLVYSIGRRFAANIKAHAGR